MVSGGFGTHPRGRYTLDEASSFRCRKRSSKNYLMRSLMGSYGELIRTVYRIFLTLTIYTLRFGRDNFQEAMKLAQKAEMKDIDWTQFKYMAFDLPVHKGTYEERYRALGSPCLQRVHCFSL